MSVICIPEERGLSLNVPGETLKRSQLGRFFYDSGWRRQEAWQSGLT
jgi:hypothetical protein